MARVTPNSTSIKVLNITYPSPQETLLSTPETLPTSEPATPQISYTVSAQDLPQLSFQPFQVIWIAQVIGAGKAVTAAIIYMQMKKNGTFVVMSNTSVSANNFYTVNCFFYDVQVGDVLEISLWSNQTDSNWDYKAFFIYPTRLAPMKYPGMLSPCNFTTVAALPNLTLGSPYFANYSLYLQHDGRTYTSINSATNIKYLYFTNTGIFKCYMGDNVYLNLCAFMVSSTYRPYATRNYLPTQIVMRGLRID